MTQIEEFKEGLQYSEEVRNAVRYGYLYRKAAENRADVHYCLADSSDVLLWIGNLILGGIGWDMLKIAVKELYERIAKQKVKNDTQTNDVFSDETKLKEFYVYIKEFNEHRMSVTKKQFLYVKEEIIADYMREESGKIYEKEDRLPTNEELIKNYKEALDYAERVLK